MNRVAKIALLSAVGVPIALIVAGLVWFGALWAGYYYKWGWVEVPLRYKLTFSVELGGVT